MKPRTLHSLLLLLSSLMWPALASAAPLTVSQLAVFQTYLECRNVCQGGKTTQIAACETSCGAAADAAGAVRTDWDKNRNSSTDLTDYELAVLENRDAATNTLICYENSAVVPKNACGLATCVATQGVASKCTSTCGATPTAQCLTTCGQTRCADADGDGLRAYQETLIGTLDTVANPVCATNSQCGGWTAECRFAADANSQRCLSRVCTAPGSSCTTAFHLEQVVQDNNEVMVRVWYDYSPTPATVLDLNINFEPTALQLTDSRPLDVLTRLSKSLAVKQDVANKTIRLVVLSPASTAPIPFGPIAELVFTRTSSLQSTVGFVLTDTVQTVSMAPNPGAHRAALSNDSMWGTPISVAAQVPGGNRLMLHYSFDNPNQSIDVSDVKNGTALCNLASECRNETRPAERARLIAKYDRLQRGVTASRNTVEGVSGTGAFLDGFGNHLELPITLNDPAAGSPYSETAQSFTLSTWFYNEGDARSGLDGQVLFSHNAQQSEATRYGVMISPTASTFSLTYFEGDVTVTTGVRRSLRTGLLPRTWYHLAMTVDAATRQIAFYLNGAQITAPFTMSTPPLLACPQLETSAPGLVLHNYGQDITGGKPAEALFFASSKDNLFGVEMMDLNGLSQQSLRRIPDSSAQDPDYHPSIDKIVYSSSKGGNYEIWLANGDGSNPVQITSGFGDTRRGMFARRPKWHPKAKAIVFESNAYDLNYRDPTATELRIGDNTARAYQLFYIPYDDANNKVAVLMPGASTPVESLSYASLVTGQSVHMFRLTHNDLAFNHYDAAWLRSSVADASGTYIGELLFTRADATYRRATIRKVLIRDLINTSVTQDVTPFTPDGSDVRLLAARRYEPVAQAAVDGILYSKEYSTLEPARHFTAPTPTEVGSDITVTITYQPQMADYPATCWDKNLDGICQGQENRNGSTANGTPTGVPTCDVNDCLPSSARDLFLAYNPTIVRPAKDASGQIIVTPGSWLTTNRKALVLSDNSTSVKIGIASDFNDLPIPAGTQIAQVRFVRSVAGAHNLALQQRTLKQEVYTWNGVTAPVRFTVGASDFEEILDARFSPSVDRLVLAGIQNARPIIARTHNLSGTASMQKLSVDPVRVEGLDWEKVEATYPCNWVGAYRNPRSGVYTRAFRGALDEFKVYSYVRPTNTFASEAARGLERLAKDKRNTQVASATGSCSTSLDCPDYQVCCLAGDTGCTLNKCYTRDCNFTDRPCREGVCTLTPVALEGGRTSGPGTPGTPDSVRWTCSVECSPGANGQCGTQECLNGPCSICSARGTCVECQSGPRDLGGIIVNYTEGCPDRNSFMCDQGSCQSECYSFENGQSVYLCDDALEFCKQGRCVPNRWDWTDLAPATFAGIGQMELSGITTTIATSQLYPVEVFAFGMEDYGHDPEVQVEGIASGAYGGAWFEVGRITVTNKTAEQATGKPYVLYTPYKVNQLRFRLVNPPYANMTAGATGLTTRDSAFCASDAWSAADRTLCYRRANSSMSQLGYPTNVSQLESIRACQGLLPACSGAQTVGCCPTYGAQPDLYRYLIPGYQSVVISKLEVMDQPIAFDSNPICSYEGQQLAVDDLGRERAMVFGSLYDPSTPTTGTNRESSNRAIRLRAANPTVSWGLTTPDARYVDRNTAVLNCAYVEYNVAAPRVAQAVTAQILSTVYNQTQAGGRIENGNGCFAPKGTLMEPCFEWIGSEVSLDPFNAPNEQYRTLDFDLYHSLGYEACRCVGPEDPVTKKCPSGQVDCSDTRSLRN